MDDLGRSFLDLAIERGRLTVEARDQIEAAVTRAEGEKHQLTPWRAAFVRGLLSRGEVDKLLAEASKRVEEADGDSSMSDILGSSADTEALDNRLGVLALQTRVVTDGQLDQAVAAQRRERKAQRPVPRLGDALVSEGIVAPAVMEGLLILQGRIRETGRDDSRTEAIAQDLRFGQVALDARLLTERELELALTEQRRRAAKGGRALAAEAGALGSLLIELGSLSREARDLVLELQEQRASRPAAPPSSSQVPLEDSDKLGRMLIESRIVSEQQVEQALSLQRDIRAKGLDRKLGELLVLQGSIDRSILATFLKAQAVRRRPAPARRRRTLPDELLPDDPRTVLLGTGLALVLVLCYFLVVDGFSLLREAHSEPAAADHSDKSGG